mmetsp:Transcript_45510/g.72293  ORF Transcript_45510/g.72293 Transcript_45510/m.72293 type:complete len:146 (-) Transcript_45510:92-529(-)
MDLPVKGMLPSRHTSLGRSSFHKLSDLSGPHFATPNHTNTIASKTQLQATPWHPAVSITEDSSDPFQSKVARNITTQPGQLVVAMPVVGAKAQQGSAASACEVTVLGGTALVVSLLEKVLLVIEVVTSSDVAPSGGAVVVVIVVH